MAEKCKNEKNHLVTIKTITQLPRELQTLAKHRILTVFLNTWNLTILRMNDGKHIMEKKLLTGKTHITKFLPTSVLVQNKPTS